MKRSIFRIALEDLMVPDEEPVEIESPGFAKSLQTVLEDECEFDNVCKAIGQIEDTIDEIDASTEHLTVLRNTIEQYGISGPMMIAADHSRDLVNAGICPAYEELADTPAHDVNAAVTIEGINNVLNSITNRVASVVKNVGELMTTLSIESRRLTGSYEQSLMTAEKYLEGAAFDETRFKEMNIRGISKASFTRLIGVCNQLVSTINTGKLETIISEFSDYLRNGSLDIEGIKRIEKQLAVALRPLSGNVDMKELLGISVNVDDTDLVAISSSKPRKENIQLVGQLGWRAGDVKMALSEARKVVSEYKTIDKHIGGVSKLCSQAADILKDQVSRLSKLSPEESTGYKEAISGIQRAVMINRRLMSASSKMPKIVAGAALQVAGAAIKTIQ